MKKHTYTTLGLSLFLSTCLAAGGSPLIKNFAYAEDNVNALQQDIIYAKQKQQAISGKVESVNLYMDNEKSRYLQEEAEGMIQQLVEKDVSGSRTPITRQEKSVQEVRLEVKKGPAVKPPQPPKKDREKTGWPWPKLVYKERLLTDGDALYKVAVSDDKVTLKEAIDIAVANSIQMRAYKKKIQVAESKLVEAKRALFPTAQGVAEWNGGLVGGTEGNPSGRFYKGKNWKLNLTQPIFYGGELILTVKLAAANLKSAKEEYDKNKNDFITQVRNAYYGVIKAEYNVQYQWELYEKVTDIHQRTKKAHELKLIAEVNYLNIESMYHQVFFQVESAKNDLLSANIVLHQVLTLNRNEPLPVDLKLPFSKVNVEFEEMLGRALENNADVRIKLLSLESAEYGLQIYGAKRLPRVDLRGSLGMLGESYMDSQAIEAGDNDLNVKPEWFIGMTGSMPWGPNSVEYTQIKHKYGPTVLALHGSEDWSHRVTFNLFDKLADITDEQNAQATLLQAQSDLQKAQDDLTIRVKDDFYNLQKSLIQIDSSIAKVRYQSKQVGILEYMMTLQESSGSTRYEDTSTSSYIEGLLVYTESKYSFIQAVTDYDLAVGSLAVDIGDPDYFDTQTKS